MQTLNLPKGNFRFKRVGEKHQVFDDLRKKFVALTPEEWVRQHFIHYLLQFKKYPPGLVAVEMLVKVNGLKQRADIVAHNRQGKPVVVVECKAPSVAITKQVFDQAARYNMQLDVRYLIVTNGLQHFCARLTGVNGSYQLEKEIPDFSSLNF